MMKPPQSEVVLPPIRGLPTLHMVQPTAWPKRPESNSRTGTASGGKPPPEGNIIHNTNDLTEAVPLGKRRLQANTTLSLRIGWKEPW